MSQIDEFMKIQSWSEYEDRKEEFSDIDYKNDNVQKHLREIMANDAKKGIIVELYKKPRSRKE